MRTVTTSTLSSHRRMSEFYLALGGPLHGNKQWDSDISHTSTRPLPRSGVVISKFRTTDELIKLEFLFE